MSRLNVSRRALIVGSIRGLLVACTGALVGCDRAGLSAAPARHPLADSLVGLFRMRPWARAIGKAYLWPLPRRFNESELVDRVLSPDRQRRVVGAPRWKLRREVRAQLEEDFAAGRPVSVGGWLLSETAVSLCALAADDPAE